MSERFTFPKNDVNNLKIKCEMFSKYSIFIFISELNIYALEI